MELTGLSIDQAPPISSPLRFFVTAPIFGIIAGILILLSDSQTLMSRYSIDAILVTHSITIGMFAFIMLGSLTQMLPVLASAKIAQVKRVSLISYLLLVVGLLSMIFGLKLQLGFLLSISYSSLGIGFLLMVFSIINAIKNVKHFTATLKGMSASLVFAFFIVLMGVYLLYEYATNSLSFIYL